MTSISRRDVIRAAAAAAAASSIPTLHAFGAGPAGAPCGQPVVHEKVAPRFRPISLESQQLEGLLADRMKVNIEGRLLRIWEHEMLVGFTQRDQGGDPTGDWLGEHAGKFLDAACNGVRYTGNAELRSLVERVAKTLIASQAEDGYLGTYTAERRWKSWDVWVHKYNLIGLLSYYELSVDPAALSACSRIGDLLCNTLGDAPGMLNIVESGEHVGMAATSVLEPMCKLYRFTGEPRYLDFCNYIVRAYDSPAGPRLVSALLEHGSVARTANGKVYEMLSNFNGIFDLHLITGEARLLTVVLRAWEDIVANQLYITGTMSAGEQFVAARRLLSLDSSHVGETCVNVTWLQLNLRLLKLTGEARFAQQIERTLYNQMLAAQDPTSGDICYYTPLVGSKEYSNKILCCVSSAPRGITAIPEMVWGVEENAFAIHLYTAGRATFEMRNVAVDVKSQTQFPTSGDVVLTVDPHKPVQFKLRLRVPDWTRRFEVRLGEQTHFGRAGEMLEIDRRWRPGSELKIHMDLSVAILPAPDPYPDYLAIRRGPQVLAMEKQLNSPVPFLHRVAIDAAKAPGIFTISQPSCWIGQQIYEVDGIVGLPETAQQLRFEQQRIRLVPFCDARSFRVWMTRSDRMRRDVPPVTAFERGELSEWKYLPEAEFLTDEDSLSYSTADPRNPRLAKYGRTTAERGGVVWFAVKLGDPAAISRIVFRHGAARPSGGWFDTSKGKPKVLVMRAGAKEWEEIGTLESYPLTNAATLPWLTDGQLFEFKLAGPIVVQGIRVLGNSAGEFASCGELAAFA